LAELFDAPSGDCRILPAFFPSGAASLFSAKVAAEPFYPRFYKDFTWPVRAYDT
jgi:hypothetical protein